MAATIQVTENKTYASASSTCQAIQNEYPKNANAGQKIVITTTVTSPCEQALVTSIDYDQVIVNILPLNSARILSTAPVISGPAVNTVTAPATGGPWSLIVQVLWIDYPVTGILAMYQTTITIEINGPLVISTTTSHTVYSTKSTSSRIASSTVSSYSTVASVKVISSTILPNSTITNESTFITPSALPSSPSLNIQPYSWLESTGAVILAVVVVVLVVGIFALKRRRS